MAPGHADLVLSDDRDAVGVLRDDVPVRAQRLLGAVAELTGDVVDGATLGEQQRREAVPQVVVMPTSA